MALRDEIESKYTDEDGLILERPNSSAGPDTGNGIENLCIYNLLLHTSGQLTKDDYNKFCSVIRSCEIEKGLYNRGPRKPGDLIGHDDIVALSGVSSVICAPFAKDIANYGVQYNWSFNNVDPGTWTLQSFQGRHVDLIPFWLICGGRSAWWIAQVLLCNSIIYARGDAGPMILKWIQCRALMDKLGRYSIAADMFKKSLLRSYPEGMKSVFSEYYGPQHPFAKYSPVF